MTKIAVAFVAFVAFIYAVFLVLANRPLPNPKRFSGPRRRFVLVTLLFVGLMTPSCRPMCYVQAPSPSPTPTSRYELGTALKAIWRTLDPAESEKFRRRLEAAAGEGVIRRKTAEMLAIAHSELAYHKQRTRGKGPFATCYIMTPLGNTLGTTRENALRQLELLEKARKSGTIDEQTAFKAHAVLAKEVEMLHRSRTLMSGNEWQAQNRVAREYADGKIIPGDSASVAAGMIVEMEDGLLPQFTVAKRLADMKERVENLLNAAPSGNDWNDPDIHPNVTAVLEEAGLVPKRPMVTCYDRVAAPVKARSDELKELQQQLLDKNVDAGVLDDEVAARAAQATANETTIDYATEEDIRQYQKTARRAIRLLHSNGELPSSFVSQLEDALDIEIIAFNPDKALRNDARYHLRSLLRQPIGDEIIKALEKRGIIPPARNHRCIMKYFGPTSEPGDELKKQLTEFLSLIDGDGTFDLPNDGQVIIQNPMIQRDNTEYRLRIRAVCRALIKTGLVESNRLQEIEELIAIPIVGRLEAN